MILVDTNVLAYLLIDGEHTDDARKLFERDSDWRSESFILVEFSNALVRYVATGKLREDEARRLLARAENFLQGKLLTASHVQALATAAAHGTTAYDARYLAVAQNFAGKKLVTEDKRLRLAAPALTQSIAEALASA